MDGDRNSFADFGGHFVGMLRAVFGSKALMALFGTIGTGIAALYSYNGGIDLGLSKATKVTDLDAKVTAIETALGESQADVIAFEARLIESDKRVAATEEHLKQSDKTDLRRNIDLWRVIVLTNAPSKKIAALASDYEQRIDALYPGYKLIDVNEKNACDTAYMVLRWGSPPSR